jgi:2-(1,2-epoxy-1,2-dihydrophenyl)acetyl-CoA isomerase
MSVRIESDGLVLRVVLARPDIGNAIDGDLVNGLMEAVDQAIRGENDGSVRALLLLAEGPNFCTGGDIRTFRCDDPGLDPGMLVGALAESFHRALLAITSLPVPVIAGVRGWVAGAGIGLACAGDVVVCGTSTRMRPAYISLGLTPDGGVSWRLARALGRARALDVLLSDGVLTAAEAQAGGLVSRVVADNDVDGAAANLARGLAKGPTAVMVRIRDLVDRAALTGLGEHLDVEADAIAVSAGDAAGREGVCAFLERRPARFAGAGL